MAQPQQADSSSSFPSIILVLIMSVGAILAYKAPLPSSRPAEALVISGNYPAQQNIDARLWQDPFEVVKKTEPKTSWTIESEARSEPMKDGVVPVNVKVSAPPATSAQTVCEGKQALVMAVMVSGAPYAEAAEARRRTRYAVVSGLGRSGYVPEDREHIGSITANVEDSNDKKKSPVSVIVPFEWFQQATKEPILVLWVNETPIRGQPLAGIKQIVEQACPEVSNNRETVLIGPSNSDTLLAMMGEVNTKASDRDQSLNTFLESLRIYSPKATAPDGHLLQKLSDDAAIDQPTYCADTGKTVASELMAKVSGLQFHRTIATDCALAKALVDELQLRGVQADDGIALISEWDTTYGRALPQAFMEMNKAVQKKSIWQFSYLRGLDGKLPGDSADKKTATDKKPGDNDSAAIEMAFGNHQKDYLRRIAERVADLDQRLKHCKDDDGATEAGCSGDGVKAIGILGSDVYDKLLILRALRPRFPEVIFFTTDLDAGLLHTDEWDFARNLVVASGYGLRLNGWLQREIPPFRDGYQTAYFLSVLAAMMEPEREAMANAERWSSRSRIFEIGRSQAVDLSITADDSKECDLADCNSPHPYVKLPTKPRWYQLLPLPLILLIWLYQVKQIDDLRSAVTTSISIMRWIWGLTAVLFLGLSLLLYRIWKYIFVTGTAGGGEPFSWFEGVSIWPSVLLCAFTGLLALYLLLRGMRHLYKSDEKLTTEFFTKREDIFIVDNLAVSTWCVTVQRLKNLFKRPTQRPSDDQEAISIWRDAVQPRPFTARLFWRLVVGVLLFAVVAWWWISLFSEVPNIPYRGVAAYAAHWYTLIFAILSFLFLLAFVVDSTRRTCCLATRLGNSKRTLWPQDAVAKWFKTESPEPDKKVPPPQYQDDWIDIQLIAVRTTVVGSFIYYPFLILSLIILARSPFIDNWQIPLGLGSIFVFYLIIAIVCALSLRNAAERARRHALAHITQEIINALGDETRKQEVEQMKLIKEAILAEHRGAFSSFLHQPWIKALLLPLGSYSGIQLVESLSLMNL